MSITVTLDVDYTRSELSDPEHKLVNFFASYVFLSDFSKILALRSDG